MGRLRSNVSNWAIIGVLSVVAGCDAPEGLQPLSPDPARSPNIQVGNATIAIPDEYPQLGIGNPEDIPPERDDSSLARLVGEAGGAVVIGIRDPEAAKTRTTGVLMTVDGSVMVESVASIEAHGVEVIRVSTVLPYLVARISPEVVSALRQLPFIDYLSPQIRIPLAHLHGSEMEAETRSWGIDIVNAPQAWNFAGAAEVTVSVLDTGIDDDHHTSGELSLPNLRACEGISSSCIDQPYDPYFYPGSGHGSHVLGIASAPQDGVGVVGVAPAVRKAVVRVCTRDGCFPSDIAWGLEWLADRGWPRHTVNMSFGSQHYFPEIDIALAYATNKGLLLVAAAGNIPVDSSAKGVEYPARDSDVVAVSGTTASDGFWHKTMTCENGETGGSEYGSEVEISAPFDAFSLTHDGDYAWDCGTSMAAPHVSGAAAQLWSLYPNWSAVQVRSRLRSRTVDLGPLGRDPHFGYGRLEAYNVLRPNISGPTWMYTGASETFTVEPVNITGVGYQWQQDRGFGWENLGTHTSQVVSMNAGIGRLYLRVLISNGTSTMESMGKVVTERECPTKRC